MVLTAMLMLTVGMVVPFRWRMEFATLWNYCVSGPILRLCTGIQTQIEGLENIPVKGPFLAICNHQSEWETYYLGRLLRPANMVIKRELLNIPVFGWAMRAARHIPIDRSKAHNSINEIIHRGKQRLKEGNNLVIFPEGTRMPAGGLKRYSRTAAKLAIEAGVPLLPIVHNAGACWSKNGEFRRGTIRMRIGPTIEADGLTADQLMDRAEQWSMENFKIINKI